MQNAKCKMKNNELLDDSQMYSNRRKSGYFVLHFAFCTLHFALFVLTPEILVPAAWLSAPDADQDTRREPRRTLRVAPILARPCAGPRRPATGRPAWRSGCRSASTGRPGAPAAVWRRVRGARHGA